MSSSPPLDTPKASLIAGWDDFEHQYKDDDLKPPRGTPDFEVWFPTKDEDKEGTHAVTQAGEGDAGLGFVCCPH